MERQRLIALIVALLLVILGLFAFLYTARKSNAAPPSDSRRTTIVQSCSVGALL